MLNTCMSGAFRGQKRALSPGTRDTCCELHCRCWEPNPGLLAEPPVPLTIQSSLQPLNS